MRPRENNRARSSCDIGDSDLPDRASQSRRDQERNGGFSPGHGSKGVERMNFRQRRFRNGLLMGAAFTRRRDRRADHGLARPRGRAGSVPRRGQPVPQGLRRCVRAGAGGVRRSGQRQGNPGKRHQRHADGARSAQLLHERQGVQGHAGSDQGRVRRSRPGSDRGQGPHQGRLPDRRHAGVPRRDQGGRHHHRARRQDGARACR